MAHSHGFVGEESGAILNVWTSLCNTNSERIELIFRSFQLFCFFHFLLTVSLLHSLTLCSSHLHCRTCKTSTLCFWKSLVASCFRVYILDFIWRSSFSHGKQCRQQWTKAKFVFIRSCHGEDFISYYSPKARGKATDC